jgi:hypothetical protein
MASSRCVEFRARLLALAGSAIVAMVIVLALGYDAALDRTPVCDPFSGRMTVLVPAGSVFLLIWTRNAPPQVRLSDSRQDHSMADIQPQG